MTDPMPILRKARDLIAAKGWQRDHLGSPFAGYSPEGAIWDAAGLLRPDGQLVEHPATPAEQAGYRAATAAFAVLAGVLGDRDVQPRRAFAVVVEWNAYEPASAADVLAVFDAAIAHGATGLAA
jgi:hypothetical protein